jgi:hypothetical protein
MKPDVLALEEMGSTNALLELRAALKNATASISPSGNTSPASTQHPRRRVEQISHRRAPSAHQRELSPRRSPLPGQPRLCRGGNSGVAPGFTFTLIAAHLKSRRPSPDADEAEQRWQEAKILRASWTRTPPGRSRTPTSSSLAISMTCKIPTPPAKSSAAAGFKLTDTRPAERNGDTAPNPVPVFEPRKRAGRIITASKTPSAGLITFC